MVSLPLVSAIPGVSMNSNSIYFDPLQSSNSAVVSDVSDCSLALTLNLPCNPHKVLSNELFPTPVDPITTKIFLSGYLEAKILKAIEILLTNLNLLSILSLVILINDF